MKWLRVNCKILILLVFSITSVILWYCNLDNPQAKLLELYENQDIHFNVASINAIFAGFLFTSFGILLSLLSKDSVKRLWDNGYMDCVCNSIILGIFFHIASIIFSLPGIFDLLTNENSIHAITFFEIATLCIGVVLFILSTVELIQAFKQFKKGDE